MSVLKFVLNNLIGFFFLKIEFCCVVDLSNNYFFGGLVLSKWSVNFWILDFSYNNLSGIIDNVLLI